KMLRRGRTAIMPIHDWTRVLDSTFHAFHSQWGGRLVAALNGGLLPSGYYAMPEQIATRMQTDVLTLHRLTTASPGAANGSRGWARRAAGAAGRPRGPRRGRGCGCAPTRNGGRAKPSVARRASSCDT